MLKKQLLVAFAVVMLIFACACEPNTTEVSSNQSSPDYPVTIANITLKNCPQRIVSLSPSITSVINELGSSAQLVGVCNSSNTDRELPRLGSAALPDVSVILSLNPDLILTNTPLPIDISERLELEEIPVAVVEAADSIDEMEHYYRIIAQLVSGKQTGESNARLTFERVMQKIEAIKQQYKDAQGAKICLILADGVVATGDSLIGQLIEVIGCTNIAADNTDYNMTCEQIAQKNPEYIFCPALLKNAILDNPSLKKTSAVINQNVFGISISDLERQGQETYRTLELMADLIVESQI